MPGHPARSISCWSGGAPTLACLMSHDAAPLELPWCPKLICCALPSKVSTACFSGLSSLCSLPNPAPPSDQPSGSFPDHTHIQHGGLAVPSHGFLLQRQYTQPCLLSAHTEATGSDPDSALPRGMTISKWVNLYFLLSKVGIIEVPTSLPQGLYELAHVQA